jgi:hypothetical protein
MVCLTVALAWIGAFALVGVGVCSLIGAVGEHRAGGGAGRGGGAWGGGSGARLGTVFLQNAT